MPAYCFILFALVFVLFISTLSYHNTFNSLGSFVSISPALFTQDFV